MDVSFRGHHSTYSGPNKGRTQAGANQVPGRSELQNQAGSVPSTQPSTRHPCPLPSESPAAASAALAEWQLSTPHAPHLPGSALTPRQPGCRKKGQPGGGPTRSCCRHHCQTPPGAGRYLRSRECSCPLAAGARGAGGWPGPFLSSHFRMSILIKGQKPSLAPSYGPPLTPGVMEWPVSHLLRVPGSSGL